MNELSFVYSGEVKFKYIINGKLFESTYKNAGLPYLMKMFAMAVTGNPLREADIPCFLDLRKKSVDNGNVQWESILTQQLPLSGKTYSYATDQSPANWVAKFTAAINHSILKSDISEDDASDYRLYLYGDYDSLSEDNPYHDFAFLAVDAKDLAKIIPGTQAIVEWSVQIRNK